MGKSRVNSCWNSIIQNLSYSYAFRSSLPRRALFISWSYSSVLYLTGFLVLHFLGNKTSSSLSVSDDSDSSSELMVGSFLFATSLFCALGSVLERLLLMKANRSLRRRSASVFLSKVSSSESLSVREERSFLWLQSGQNQSP